MKPAQVLVPAELLERLRDLIGRPEDEKPEKPPRRRKTPWSPRPPGRAIG